MKLESFCLSVSFHAIIPSHEQRFASEYKRPKCCGWQKRQYRFDVDLFIYKTGRARVFGLSVVGYKYGPKSNDMHSRHMKYSSGPAT